MLNASRGCWKSGRGAEVKGFFNRNQFAMKDSTLSRWESFRKVLDFLEMLHFFPQNSSMKNFHLKIHFPHEASVENWTVAESGIAHETSRKVRLWWKPISFSLFWLFGFWLLALFLFGLGFFWWVGCVFQLILHTMDFSYLCPSVLWLWGAQWQPSVPMDLLCCNAARIKCL